MCMDCRELETEIGAQEDVQYRRDAVRVHPNANVKRVAL